VNAGLLGLIGAPTYPMLRDATQRTFFEILEWNQIPYDFHKQENLLTLRDMGSEIIFRSLDSPDRLRGTNLAWFGVDETTYTQEESWLRLEARLRHVMAKELCGYGCWTPNGYDWVYDRFIGPAKKVGYEAVLAQAYENVHLPKDFYARLETSYDSKFASQEVHGEYLSMRSGQVYHAFRREVNIRECAFDPTATLCWALDFNVNPMCAVVAQILDRSTTADLMIGRKVVQVEVLDEVYLPDANTWEACQAFVEKTQNLSHSRISVGVYGDASGAARQTAGAGTDSDWQAVRQFFSSQSRYSLSFHTRRANPQVRDRINAVNAALCNSTGESKLFIDPKCARLVRDLERVRWKDGVNLIDKSDLALTHVSDALGYLIETELGVKAQGGWRKEQLV